MTRITIAYASDSGHTLRLARAIAQGAPAANLLDVQTLDDSSWALLHASDAIIFGSPTFMGNVSGPFKTFMDQTSDFWTDRQWKDKVAAGFTIGSSPGGDKANTLSTLAIFAAQHGMIWVGQDEVGPPSQPDNPVNHDGYWLGLAVTASRDKTILIEDHGLESARRFGARIATLTNRMARSPSD